MRRSTVDHGSGARAGAPIGTVLLVAVATLLAAGVAAGAIALAEPPDPAPTVVVAVDVDGDRVTVHHRNGDPIDARDLRLRVSVDGEPLAHQPPVPFFSATGFSPGPTGPFNTAGESVLRAGDAGSFRIAGTNEPRPEPGSTVTVELFVDDHPVAEASGTA